jgi:hypothetical protein
VARFTLESASSATATTGRVYEIPDPEGFENESQDSRRKAAQRALQGEADREACGSKDRDERRRLHAELGQRRDNGERDHYDVREASHEGHDRLVRLHLSQQFRDYAAKDAGGDPSHNEDNDGADDLDAVSRCEFNQVIVHVLHDLSLDKFGFQIPFSIE